MSQEYATPKRVWPTLLFGIAILATSAFAAFVGQGTAVVSAYGGDFPPASELMERWQREQFPTAGGFARVVLPLHVTMAVLAVGIALLARGAWTGRLGLGRGTLDFRFLPVLMLASLAPWALGGWLSGTLFAERSAQWTNTVQAFNHSQGFDALFIVGWGVVGASFSEDVLFQGFLLCQLLRRWSAWLCIPLVALLFAFFHPAPDLVVYVLPMAIWSGLLTWHFRSIWPSIFCHGFWNLAISLLCRNMGEDSAAIWTHPPRTAWIVLLVSGAAMALAIPRLRSRS